MERMDPKAEEFLEKMREFAKKILPTPCFLCQAPKDWAPRLALADALAEGVETFDKILIQHKTGLRATGTWRKILGDLKAYRADV